MYFLLEQKREKKNMKINETIWWHVHNKFILPDGWNGNDAPRNSKEDFIS